MYPRIGGSIGKCRSLLLICNEYRIDKRLVMPTDAEQTQPRWCGRCPRRPPRYEGFRKLPLPVNMMYASQVTASGS